MQEEFEIQRIKKEIQREKEMKELDKKQASDLFEEEKTGKTIKKEVISIEKRKNEYSFKELSESESMESSTTKNKKKSQIVGSSTYAFRYNAIYSLVYITILMFLLYFFILLRDFVQNHLNEQLTNTLNTILKFFDFPSKK